MNGGLVNGPAMRPSENASLVYHQQETVPGEQNDDFLKCENDVGLRSEGKTRL